MLQDDSREAEKVWKAQDEDKQAVLITFQPEELAALVRTRERLSRFLHYAVVVVMSTIAAGFLYNVASGEPGVDQVGAGVGIWLAGLCFWDGIR